MRARRYYGLCKCHFIIKLFLACYRSVVAPKIPSLMSLTPQPSTGVTRTVVNTLSREPEKRAVSSGDNSVKVTIHSSVSNSSSDKTKTGDSSKALTIKRTDRKISVVDESAFEPNYSDSESDDGKASTGNARTAAPNVSADDQKDKKEKKKHKKEKKKKHKHKDDKDKDPERKKHKKNKRKDSKDSD